MTNDIENQILRALSELKDELKADYYKLSEGQAKLEAKFDAQAAQHNRTIDDVKDHEGRIRVLEQLKPIVDNHGKRIHANELDIEALKSGADKMSGGIKVAMLVVAPVSGLISGVVTAIIVRLIVGG